MAPRRLCAGVPRRRWRDIYRSRRAERTRHAAYLDVEPAEGNVSANETVAFEELSPAQQELFERARNSSELVEIPGDLDYTVFAENRYVHYQNRTYEVAVAVS
ncbi:hypothetical protein [Haloarcula salinisoli]|uniref:DUF7979 domain-containing protein n=1 Tax=Haloarcula salinisoli TaxID=2487746 RepID=A0A8J7YHI5_9EURY|nr:hypothetical protein [Halomicroarcula salinisoli]MBX0303573.1 hypothetical protein [Halomicroarcula salinisoli]